jgi:hypothetical protein
VPRGSMDSWTQLLATCSGVQLRCVCNTFHSMYSTPITTHCATPRHDTTRQCRHHTTPHNVNTTRSSQHCAAPHCHDTTRRQCTTQRRCHTVAHWLFEVLLTLCSAADTPDALLGASHSCLWALTSLSFSLMSVATEVRVDAAKSATPHRAVQLIAAFVAPSHSHVRSTTTSTVSAGCASRVDRGR